jgi:hypothetical protein
MGDLEGDLPQTPQKPELSDELSRSLGSIWQRHAGGRPSDATIEISGNVVKFVMVDAVSAAAEPAEDGSAPNEALSPDSGDYRLEVIAAVTKITGRRVRGFIPKRDSKTDVATDTYILEPVRAHQ